MDAFSFAAGLLAGIAVRRVRPRKHKLSQRGPISPLVAVGSSESADFHSRVDEYRSIREDLELGALLGQGSFGRVYEAKWRGALVAVKILEHQRAGSSSHAAVGVESMIALATVHPNVVPVYEVFSSAELDKGRGSSLEFDQRTYMIMERADRGSLAKQGSKLSEELKQSPSRALLKILRCLLDVTFALEYLHGIGVTHGDLKPANILCKSVLGDARGFQCKVCDFGLASVANAMSPDKMFTSTQNRGGLLYAAPERLRGEQPGRASDIFSLGTLAWQLLDFRHEDTMLPDAVVQFRMLQDRWLPEINAASPPELTAVIRHCWAWDPADRPDAHELRDLLSSILFKVIKQVKAAAAYAGPHT